MQKLPLLSQSNQREYQSEVKATNIFDFGFSIFEVLPDHHKCRNKFTDLIFSKDEAIMILAIPKSKIENRKSKIENS
jgi:hypothetical protein